MIVTLTANPSFDRTIALSHPLVRGGVTRALSVQEQAGGKGVNISRAAAAAGVETTAVFPALDDSPFADELRHLGITCRPIEPTGSIRVNLTITEPDGTTTKLNTAGASADADLLERMSSAVVGLASAARWVVLAGSLPPGTPNEWYAELATALAGTPAHVAVDTSDRPLVELAARVGTARPDLLKPNAEELAGIAGGDAAQMESDPEAAAVAASRLVDAGAGAVLVTLGGAGAVLVDPTGAWRAEAPPIDVVSTVGAGDSSLFGYVLGDLRGYDPADRLRLAIAYGSAAASLPGTTVPTPEQVRPDQVTVHSFDVRREPASARTGSSSGPSGLGTAHPTPIPGAPAG
jgi:1-phosphofructokinase